MKRFLNTVLALIAAAVVCIPVFAQVPKENAKLTVYFHAGDEKISGAEFSVYQTAKIKQLFDGTADFESIDPFTDVSNMTQEESRTAAAKFAAMPAKEKAKAVTDADGNVVFDGLEAGIYLVKETDQKDKAAGYESAEPFLVVVPSYDQQKKQWNYDVTASPKTEPKNIRKDTKEDVPDFHQNKDDEDDYVDYVPTGDVPVLPIALGVAAGAAILLVVKWKKKNKD